MGGTGIHEATRELASAARGLQGVAAQSSSQLNQASAQLTQLSTQLGTVVAKHDKVADQTLQLLSRVDSVMEKAAFCGKLLSYNFACYNLSKAVQKAYEKGKLPTLEEGIDLSLSIGCLFIPELLVVQVGFWGLSKLASLRLGAEELKDDEIRQLQARLDELKGPSTTEIHKQEKSKDS